MVFIVLPLCGIDSATKIPVCQTESPVAVFLSGFGGFVLSSLNLHPVLESEPDVLSAVHRGVVHKAVPVILVKFRERAVQLFQGGNKSSDFFPLCLPLRDGLAYF